MKYLHTMVRVSDLAASLRFLRDLLGLRELRRIENEKRAFHARLSRRARRRRRADRADLQLGARGLSIGRAFGHLAYEVDDIYAICAKLSAGGVTINRPPRDGRMAFVRSPDNISVELLQKGGALPPAEPWASMPNTGSW